MSEQREGYLPKDQRKTILFLCDDIRMNSGVATMGREMVVGTCHKYNWVNIGGSVQHPDKGKVFDLNDATSKHTGISDPSVKVYPVDGYGNPDILRQIMGAEKPHAILHFTDPRFWIWLYQMEREIRQKTPILYYNIWDDLPYPMYNKPYYESCDALFAISKQTENINKNVVGRKNYVTLDELKNDGSLLPGKSLIHYVPHGICSKTFRPMTTQEELDNMAKIRKELFKNKEYDFVLFYNSRNIRRKQTSDVILSYRLFCDTLTEEQSKKCCLLMHTQPRDENGTDLVAVKEALCPKYDIVFSDGKASPEMMNIMYSIADVSILITSNEGFGLSTAESIMAGTPIIVNVTGGLQDQIGQTDDDGNPVRFTTEQGTNEDGRYRKHGIWAKPIFPSNRSIQGSIPTPFIADSRAKVENVVEAILYWYKISSQERKKAGLEGRRWAMNEGGLNAENMCAQLIKGTDLVFKNWKPREKFSIHKPSEFVGNSMPEGNMGMVFDPIDFKKIEEDIEKFREKVN